MRSDSPSVLIVRLDAVGDAMTLVPLIAALRGRGARVGAVLRQANSEVFSARALDRRHIAGGNLRVLAAEIEARRYDYALIATEKPLGYRIAAHSRIPKRIGFENGWGKPFKTLWVRRLCTNTIFRTAGLDARAPHECEVVFSLARELLPDAEPSRDSRVLREYVLDSAEPPDGRVAFQVTDKWARLGASLDEVAALAQSVRERYDVRWLAAESERAFGQRFTAATGAQLEYFSSIPPWKRALGSARAVVAPDSGAVHVAGMVGTPVVACFAPERFELQTARWAPWAAPSGIVRLVPGWPAAAADSLAELFSGSPQSAYKG